MNWGLWLAGFVLVVVVGGVLGGSFGAVGVPFAVVLGAVWGRIGYRWRKSVAAAQ